MLTIAHLSDTHFGGPADATARTEQVLDHLLAMDPRPDVLVHTGDVADHGRAEEYAEAHRVLDRWTGPRLVVPGNHDVHAAFTLGAAPLPTALDLGPRGRLLGLSSLVDAVDGRRIDHGELSDDALAWLDAQLGESDRPAFVCLHHPPADIGLGLMAKILLREPERLAAVLARHDHVVALLVGHAHTACTTTFAGVPVLIGGGVASTVPVDAEDLPVVWEAGPPVFALHLLDDDGRLTTHWRAL